MDFLFRQKPATIPTDTIIPLHYFDDNDINRAWVLHVMMRFDDVLEPEKLRTSLVRLINIGKWRKLGARLRKNVSGRLEYHVPARFDEDRPAIAYSHVEFGSSIEDHKVARRLPKATKGVGAGIHASFEEFLSLSLRPGSPKKIDDYLYSDEPQLSLHIVSFADATLVTISWPHTFADAMGCAALLRAWCCVLNGEESKVPPLIGFDEDPLVALSTATPKEHFVLGDLLLKGFSLVTFALFYVFELFWYWRSEMHIISTNSPMVPDEYIQSLKQSAMTELATQSTSSSITTPVTPHPSFLSDNDILTSFITRLAVQQISSPSSSRPIVISNAYSIRTVLSPDVLPLEKAYISNAVFNLYSTALPAHYFFPSHTSLSAIASAVRQSIQTQGTRKQVAACAYNARATGQRPQVAGAWNSRLFAYSNWHKAKLYETDFSAAIVRSGGGPGKKVRHEKVGRPSYLHAWGDLSGYSTRHVFAIFGKDAAGHWWLSATLRKGCWEGVRRELEGVNQAMVR